VTCVRVYPTILSTTGVYRIRVLIVVYNCGQCVYCVHRRNAVQTRSAHSFVCIYVSSYIGVTVTSVLPVRLPRPAEDTSYTPGERPYYTTQYTPGTGRTGIPVPPQRHFVALRLLYRWRCVRISAVVRTRRDETLLRCSTRQTRDKRYSKEKKKKT